MRGAGERSERGEDERVVGPERLRVADPGVEAVHAGAIDLQLDVIAGLHLRSMGLHCGFPGGHHFGCGDVDEDWRRGMRFRAGTEGVKEKLADRMRREIAQFRQAAVAGEARGVAHECAESPMVGMLILLGGRREHESRTQAAKHGGEPDGVGGFDFEVGVAVELEEFDGGTEMFCGGLGFLRALGRRAVGARLATRADHEVHGPAGTGLAHDDATAAKFDVVGMGAEGDKRRAFRRGGGGFHF